ncbi:MAG: hypothetical protein KF746_05490 [Chitinophagaceae bacterium]|nr:hypothetical protein [Chitinophagaceae bacterium]
MIHLAGREIENTYLKEKGLSLVKCIHYDIMEDGIRVGTFFSGCRHSGDKYFHLSHGSEILIIELKRKSFFKNQYRILETKNSKAIGYLEYSTLGWLNSAIGMIALSNSEIHYFEDFFGILTKIWQKRLQFMMSSDTIKYSVEPKINEDFNSSLTGVIEIQDRHQIVSAILGIVFIDRKFRNWIRNNIN